MLKNNRKLNGFCAALAGTIVFAFALTDTADAKTRSRGHHRASVAQSDVPYRSSFAVAIDLATGECLAAVMPSDTTAGCSQLQGREAHQASVTKIDALLEIFKWVKEEARLHPATASSPRLTDTIPDNLKPYEHILARTVTVSANARAVHDFTFNRHWLRHPERFTTITVYELMRIMPIRSANDLVEVADEQIFGGNLAERMTRSAKQRGAINTEYYSADGYPVGSGSSRQDNTTSADDQELLWKEIYEKHPELLPFLAEIPFTPARQELADNLATHITTCVTRGRKHHRRKVCTTHYTPVDTVTASFQYTNVSYAAAFFRNPDRFMTTRPVFANNSPSSMEDASFNLNRLQAEALKAAAGGDVGATESEEANEGAAASNADNNGVEIDAPANEQDTDGDTVQVISEHDDDDDGSANSAAYAHSSRMIALKSGQYGPRSRAERSSSGIAMEFINGRQIPVMVVVFHANSQEERLGLADVVLQESVAKLQARGRILTASVVVRPRLAPHVAVPVTVSTASTAPASVSEPPTATLTAQPVPSDAAAAMMNGGAGSTVTPWAVTPR